MQPTFRILHCLRAPVGGLFRHVLDLATEQAAAGYQVGIIADANASDGLTSTHLKGIEPHLALGLHLVPMSRKPGLGDFSAARFLVRLARQQKANVLHGHGAKGGAYARLASRTLKARGLNVASFYTPHGGSLHFDPKSLEGRVYLTLEKVLARFTDGLIFESVFARNAYDARIGLKHRAVKVIPNGLRPDDFGDHRPNPKASDFLFVGELRHLKGVDVMLHALAELNQTQSVRARFVGGGPDAEVFQALARNLGLADATSFPGPAPAHDTFCDGRCLIVPSRAESFPYIVLEAGAMTMPIIATDVGGIPEMTHGTDLKLVQPDNVNALKTAMQQFLEHPEAAQTVAQGFKSKIESCYTVAGMSAAIADFYGQAYGKRLDQSVRTSFLPSIKHRML